MLVSTQGIVWNSVRFGESSAVVKIFTPIWGTHGFVVNGVHSAKPKIPPALIQPLTVLDMVVYHKPNADLFRVKELHSNAPFSSLMAHPVKLGIRFFLAEVLAALLSQPEPHPDLFAYLTKAFQLLDALPEDDERLKNFHFTVLIQTALQLGFAAGTPEEMILETPNFPLNVSGIPTLKLADMLIQIAIGKGQDLPTDRVFRREMLNFLLEYLRAVSHLNINAKSLQVFQEVWE